MAIYKNGSLFTQNNGAAFDEDLPPGFQISISGIYKCTNCGDEIAANKGTPLPPQNHAQHAPGKPIKWRLIAAAEQNRVA